MVLTKSKNIHCIGIGGIGVSGLAQILFHQGKKISGSDSTATEITRSLQNSGIKVTIGHSERNISPKNDLIIYSSAVLADNVELKKARELKIPCFTYAQALGELTKDYYTIAISGSHGKSTTTAMIARIAIKAGLDPTVVIGTKMREFRNRNYRVGKSNYLIIEACEYKDSFLNFYPNILVITNIEADHLDYFKNIKNYRKAFQKLAEKLTADGTIIVNQEDKNSLLVTKNTSAQRITWSKMPQTDFYLKNKVLYYKNKVITLDKKVEQEIKLTPQIPGEFNVKNAAFAAIAGVLLNVENKKIEQALEAFKGTWRRMEYKRKKGYACKFIDDYGHHPTEIEFTLNAIREKHPKDKILVIFQPHQHNRTKALLKDFAKVFYSADQLIIPDIYKVRDTAADVKSMTTDKLVHEISKYQKNVSNGNGLKNTANYIKKNHRKFDLIVTMGAGDINTIYQMLGTKR